MVRHGTILGDLGMVCAIIDHPPASSNIYSCRGGEGAGSAHKPGGPEKKDQPREADGGRRGGDSGRHQWSSQSSTVSSESLSVNRTDISISL